MADDGAHGHPQYDSLLADHETRLAALEAGAPGLPPTGGGPQPPTSSGPITLGPGDDNAVFSDYVFSGTGDLASGAIVTANKGGSATRRLRGLKFVRCDFSKQAQAFVGWFCETVEFIDCVLPEIGYCAFNLFSCDNVSVLRPKGASIFRPPPYSNAGWVNNAYLVKCDIWLPGDPVPDTVVVDGADLTYGPLWQALNAHAGRHLKFINSTIRKTPRAIFVSTGGAALEDIDILDNTLLDPITVAGGTTDMTAISFGSVAGIRINGNKISSKFAGKIRNIDQYSGANRASTGIVIGTNPAVP